MAILRCNKCNHVAEFSPEYVGKLLPCPACTQAMPVYDTTLFVNKVLQQYFLMQKQLRQLKEKYEPQMTISAQLSELDLFNTKHLASEAWHEKITNFFQQKGVQTQVNLAAVDTTGFFDETAVEIGDNYALFGDIVSKIRWGQQKEVLNFTLKLGDMSQKEAKEINAFCKRLYERTLIAKYHYQKTEKIGRVTIQNSPAIRHFFGGEWLEWYALMKLMLHFQQNNLDFSCGRNLSVVFPNEDLHELDVVFLVDGKPLFVECKTGEFRQDLNKYQRLAKRLGIRREHFVLCGTNLTDEQAAGLSSMYELTFVNPQGLIAHISRLF